jgi:hypothetical protein
MWDPQHLTTLQASTALYGDSFIFLHEASLVSLLYIATCPGRSRATAQLDFTTVIYINIFIHYLIIPCLMLLIC